MPLERRPDNTPFDQAPTGIVPMPRGAANSRLSVYPAEEPCTSLITP